MRDLGLVGRVGSEKLAARDHRIHQHGAIVVVDSRAQERGVAVGVFGRAAAEIIDDFVFGDPGGELQRPLEADGFGQVGEQLFGGRHAAGVEHLAALGIGLRK